VLLFVNNAQEAEKWLQQVLPLLNEDALCWISYPKQTAKYRADINRDSLSRLVSANSNYRVVNFKTRIRR